MKSKFIIMIILLMHVSTMIYSGMAKGSQAGNLSKSRSEPGVKKYSGSLVVSNENVGKKVRFEVAKTESQLSTKSGNAPKLVADAAVHQNQLNIGTKNNGVVAKKAPQKINEVDLSSFNAALFKSPRTKAQDSLVLKDLASDAAPVVESSVSMPQLKVDGLPRANNARQQVVLDKIAARKKAELDAQPKIEREILLDQHGIAGKNTEVETVVRRFKDKTATGVKKYETTIRKKTSTEQNNDGITFTDQHGNKFIEKTNPDGSKYNLVTSHNEILTPVNARKLVSGISESVPKKSNDGSMQQEVKITNSDGSYSNFKITSQPKTWTKKGTETIEVDHFGPDGQLIFTPPLMRVVSKQEYTKLLETAKAEKSEFDRQEGLQLEPQAIAGQQQKSSYFKQAVGAAKSVGNAAKNTVKNVNDMVLSPVANLAYKPAQYAVRGVKLGAEGLAKSIPVGMREQNLWEINKARAKKGEAPVDSIEAAAAANGGKVPTTIKSLDYAMTKMMIDRHNYNLPQAKEARVKAGEFKSLFNNSKLSHLKKVQKVDPVKAIKKEVEQQAKSEAVTQSKTVPVTETTPLLANYA